MTMAEICSLTDKNCVPCKGGVLPMAENAAREMLSQLEGWDLKKGATTLFKAYKFKNFRKALAFVNAVGEIAEAQGHHPDIALGWGYVELTIQTHKIGGLTESDFILAAKSDAALAASKGLSI